MCLIVMAARIPYSQVILGLGIGFYLVVVFAVPRLKAGLSWFPFGSFTRDVRLLSFGIALVSGIAVGVWFLWFKPNIDDLVQRYVPDYPLWLLIAAGVLFDAVNAALEEVAFRGVILGALMHSAVPTSLSLLLPAFAFGTGHINGFPRGWVGVGLATVYGFLMGVLRIRSRGIFAPWVGHVFTDVCIAVIVIAVARLS